MPASLRWEDDRIEHIAGHGVTLEEVIEVYTRRHLSVKQGKTKRKVYGQTLDGRYFTLIVGQRHSSRDWWLATARDMTPTEKRYYRQHRR